MRNSQSFDLWFGTVVVPPWKHLDNQEVEKSGHDKVVENDKSLANIGEICVLHFSEYVRRYLIVALRDFTHLIHSVWY